MSWRRITFTGHQKPVTEDDGTNEGVLELVVLVLDSTMLHLSENHWNIDLSFRSSGKYPAMYPDGDSC